MVYDPLELDPPMCRACDKVQLEEHEPPELPGSESVAVENGAPIFTAIRHYRCRNCKAHFTENLKTVGRLTVQGWRGSIKLANPSLKELESDPSRAGNVFSFIVEGNSIPPIGPESNVDLAIEQISQEPFIVKTRVLHNQNAPDIDRSDLRIVRSLSFQTL